MHVYKSTTVRFILKLRMVIFTRLYTLIIPLSPLSPCSKQDWLTHTQLKELQADTHSQCFNCSVHSPVSIRLETMTHSAKGACSFSRKTNETLLHSPHLNSIGLHFKSVFYVSVNEKYETVQESKQEWIVTYLLIL